MRAFSPQDQWKKHKSEPILAMSEGLVEATADWLLENLGLLAVLLTSVVVTRLASGDVLLAFTAATTTSMASMTSGGDSSEHGGVVFYWLLHDGHQVGLLAVRGPQLVGLVGAELQHGGEELRRSPGS